MTKNIHAGIDEDQAELDELLEHHRVAVGHRPEVRGLMALRYCWTFEVSASASACASLTSRPRSSRV